MMLYKTFFNPPFEALPSSSPKRCENFTYPLQSKLVVWLLFSQFINDLPRSNSFARPNAAVAPKVKLVVSFVLTSILATKLALWLALFKRVGERSNASDVKKSALYNAPLISPDELTF